MANLTLRVFFVVVEMVAVCLENVRVSEMVDSCGLVDCLLRAPMATR